MTQIEDAVVLVTGGQRGLGRAFVDELLARGARKVYATARDPRPSDDPRVVPLALDVDDDAAVAAAVTVADDVTIVINNAGTQQRGALLTSSIDAMKKVFETNVFGVLRVTQAFAPVLAAHPDSALIDIHSALSWGAGSGAYGASKAAAWSLTNSLRLELAPQGTHVLGVHLGYADTDMTKALDVEKVDPRQVARDALTGLENGATEVLADAVSRELKAALSGPVEGLSTSVVARKVVLGARLPV